MSVSADDPTERGSAAVTDDVLDGDSTGEPEQAGPSLIAQVLEGWELMAEAVAETDPDLASLMSSGTLVARAAIEQAIPTFIAQLRYFLASTELAPAFQEELIGELSRSISNPPCPFTLDWLAERHEQAVNAFTSDQSIPENGTRDFLAAAVSTAIRSAFDHDTPQPSADQEWRIIATLEQPDNIGHSGSLFCAASSKGLRKNVRLEEVNYQDTSYRSRPSGNVENRQWVSLADSSGLGFPRDFGVRETAGFAKTIRENPDGAAYLLQLNLGGRLAPLAQEFIEAHEQEILGLAQTLIVPVKALVPHLALVPSQVFEAVPKLLVWTIKNIITKRVGDRTVPSWVIYHTVLRPDGHAPTSVVLLRSPEQKKAAKATLVGTTCIDGEMRETVDYEDFPVVDLWPRGRFIDGATLPENATADVPVEVPERIWNWVADNGRPLVWSDCWEDGQVPTHAFRVLVPFARLPADGLRGFFQGKQRKTQAYVVALRVEVYPVTVQRPKSKRYRI
jgi:hypothetical protein